MIKTKTKETLFGIEIANSIDAYYWGKQRYDHRLYLIHFGDYCNTGGGLTIGVFAQNETDAIDELIDYVAEVYPALILTKTAQNKLSEVELNDFYIQGGNANDCMYIGYGISIDQY